MRKPFWRMNMTPDGFMEGLNRELNDTAQVVDEDFNRYATETARVSSQFLDILLPALDTA